MQEMKVARVKSDEWMVIRQDEKGNREYLTHGMKWSKWKVDGIVFFHEDDALSAFIIKRRIGDVVETPKAVPVKEPVNPFADTWERLKAKFKS